MKKGVGMKASVRELNGRQTQDDAAKLTALLDLARDHAAAFRNREGLQAAREALNLARRRHDSFAEGRALGFATLCHFQRSDHVAAVATGLDAIDVHPGDALGRSRALQTVALALASLEAYDHALPMAEKAVAEAIESEDPEREALSRAVLGLILCETGQYEAARRQYRSAALHHKTAADVIRLKKVTANLGHTYRKQGAAEERAGHPAQARLYWTQALRIYRLAFAAARHDCDDAIVLGSIAECECRVGRIDAAYADVAHGLTLARKTDNAVVRANCHLWEGHILEAMREHDSAERAFERACEAAGSLEPSKIQACALHALAALVAARGQTARAAEIEARGHKAAEARIEHLAQIRAQLGSLWNRLVDFHA
jgi:tetratricopeptide (TPR) repeat protein